MTELLTSTDLSLKSELTKRQSLIDAAHFKLRDSTNQLGTDRRRASRLQAKADARSTIRTQISNLRRSNSEQRKRALQPQPKGHHHSTSDPSTLQTNIKIGEADLGLKIDTLSLPAPSTGSSNLSTVHVGALKSLPQTQLLGARLSGYRHTNAHLQVRARELQSRSCDLERQLKRVVGLCTGVGDDGEKVEGMLEGLQTAVESERDEDIEVGRVREFLRRVDGA